MKTRLEFFVRAAGEIVLFPELFEYAWDELEEAHEVAKDYWVSTNVKLLENTDRIEVYLLDEGYNPVAGAHCVIDLWDWNVGTCFSVLFRYTRKEFRGSNSHVLHRKVIELAKVSGLPWLCYTHRKAPGEYALRYLKICNDDKQEN